MKPSRCIPGGGRVRDREPGSVDHAHLNAKAMSWPRPPTTRAQSRCVDRLANAAANLVAAASERSTLRSVDFGTHLVGAPIAGDATSGAQCANDRRVTGTVGRSGGDRADREDRQSDKSACLNADRAAAPGRWAVLRCGHGRKALAGQTAKATEQVTAQIHAVECLRRWVARGRPGCDDHRADGRNFRATADVMSRQSAATPNQQRALCRERTTNVCSRSRHDRGPEITLGISG